MFKKVLIAHGYWGRGGAEVATMYLIDALKESYEVYIITRGGFVLRELNKFAGTTIRENEIKIVTLPFKRLLARTSGGSIWHALFLRYCRIIAHKYDLCVTASQTLGWGRPAIHFLSDIMWHDELKRRNSDRFREQGILKRLLFHIGRIISGKARYELNTGDVFVANSEWTSKLSSPFTPNTPIVINPAISQDFDEIAWDDRIDSFVSIGRISPEKNLEDSIYILEQVRKKGCDVELTIFGEFIDDEYSRFILSLCKGKSWIYTPGPIIGKRKKKLLPTFKYGINTCRREAFGISTAEMIAADIIPFVPIQGGQSEIVREKELIFSNKNEGVGKIIDIIKSGELQLELRSKIIKRKKEYSTSKFRKEILDLFSKL